MGVIGFGGPLLLWLLLLLLLLLLLVPFCSILDIALAVIGGDCSSSSCCILLSRERTYCRVWSLIGFEFLKLNSWKMANFLVIVLGQLADHEPVFSASFISTNSPISSARNCANYWEWVRPHSCWNCFHPRHPVAQNCFHLRPHNWYNSAWHWLVPRPSTGIVPSAPNYLGLVPVVYHPTDVVCSEKDLLVITLNHVLLLCFPYLIR